MADTARTAKSRRVAILAAEGGNHDDLAMVMERLKKAGVHCKVVSERLGALKCGEGKEVEVDKSYATTASVLFDALFVPGGAKAVETLKQQGEAVHFVNEMFKHCKPIAALSEGVELLGASRIMGVELAEPGSPGRIVADKGVVTARGPVDMDAFMDAFVQAVAAHRHWDREEKGKVPA